MNETRAIIERIRRINSEYQYIELAVDDQALLKIKPGESLLVRPDNPESETEQWDPYLREQWWPVGINSNQLLLIERPFDHRYRPQQIMSVIGPIGQPYRFRKSLRSVVLIAYDTAPTPLTIMIGQLLHNNVDVTLVLLGTARAYNTEHIAPQVEIIHGLDNLEWPDMLMTLGPADQIFVAVGQDDERMRFSEVLALIKERRAEVPKNYVFGVFQPLMPCGIGACSACMQRVDKQLTAVCTGGPAFDLTQVQM